jgi:plasmid stabilization system protein ParE
MNVEFLPEARLDILKGRNFFEGFHVGKGDAFVGEVLSTFDQIAAFPELFGEVGPGARAVGVKRFGYVVYYRIVQANVEVLAVLHGARDPAEWQRRS